MRKLPVGTALSVIASFPFLELKGTIGFLKKIFFIIIFKIYLIGG